MKNNLVHTRLLKLKAKIKDKSGQNVKNGKVEIDWEHWHKILDKYIAKVANLNEEDAYKYFSGVVGVKISTIEEELERALKMDE